MNNICLYFQIHHPLSLQTFRYFDVGAKRSYFDNIRIENEVREFAKYYILPSNDFLLKLIQKTKGELKITFYISGTALDLFLMYAPEVLNSFRTLSDCGTIEFAGGTAYHSIVSLSDYKEEFKKQIKRHYERIEYFFDQTPQLFINSDLLYSDDISGIVAETGYPAMLTNGTQKILQWRSPNFLYSNKHSKNIRLFLRNEEISNALSAILADKDISIKSSYANEFYKLIKTLPSEEPVTNIYINYSKLGGPKSKEKFAFFKKMVSNILKNYTQQFSLPSEIISQFGTVGNLCSPEPICWKEHFHPDYYPGNDMQKDAINQLFKLGRKVNSTPDYNLQIDWQYLQTTDHFHLMDDCHPLYQASQFSSGNFKSKYDAYINYMNILDDFSQRLLIDQKTEKINKENKTRKSTIHSNLKEQKSQII